MDKNRKFGLWFGVASLLVGIISLINGQLFDHPFPNQSVRQVPPGIVFLLLGIALIFFYFRYKNKSKS